MNSDFTVAVHSLVYLEHKRQLTVNSEEIAANVCTHPVRVRRVLSRLCKAGLITSREGHKTGGYCFDGDPRRLTLLQVLDALDQKVVPPGWTSGDTDMECLIASGMGEIMRGLFEELDQACREKLARVTVADIVGAIFHNP